MGCGGWAAKKSVKHCYVCDTYGCLGSTALPEQKTRGFFHKRYSDISYIYLPDFFHIISSILPGEKE